MKMRAIHTKNKTKNDYIIKTTNVLDKNILKELQKTIFKIKPIFIFLLKSSSIKLNKLTKVQKLSAVNLNIRLLILSLIKLQ